MVVLKLSISVVLPRFEGFRITFLAGLVGSLAIVVWWVGFSTASRFERVLVTGVMAGALVTTWWLAHPSMSMMWFLACAVPVAGISWVVWAVVTHRRPVAWRGGVLVALIAATVGGWSLLRMDGLRGDHAFQFSWRWWDSPEEQLLEGGPTADPVAAPLVCQGGDQIDWPGFRGPRRDGVVFGSRIATDWRTSPPEVVWRRSVGPGWSSFAVAADRFFTQEQLGSDEVVTCYHLTTGDIVWRHADEARFEESMGGPGPRSTPAVHSGRVVALGATGILNTLDADTGELLWSRDLTTDADEPVPFWGFAASPLLLEDRVVVAASGRVLVYDSASGAVLWKGPDRGMSYSSPHLLRLGGVPQIVHLNHTGVSGLSPDDGAEVWHHPWKGAALVQPAAIDSRHLLISAGEGKGVRRLSVSKRSGRWNVKEVWTSHRLKPNFNDFVIHHGHAYGFDGRILASVDLADGSRSWKGGRYGHGQLLLLADQDLLLVVSEGGDAILVSATPEAFVELARQPLLEGKTWNHPVLVGDLLLLRNAQEMAVLRLPSGREAG